MKQIYNYTLTFFILLSLILLVTACHQNHEVPFPDNPSDYKIPEIKPFKIPPGKPLKWNKIPPEKMPKVANYPIDFNKLPSKSFNIMDVKPLKSPPQAIQIAWDDEGEMKVNLDKIPGVTVPVKKQLIGEPQISKLALSKSNLSNSGILRIGQTEGLIGNKVYAMVTDHHGTVWISTDRGLA